MRHEADVVVQRIMAACFEPARPVESEGLEPFQQDAVARLRVMLDRRGGAVLADSVGLGKTHVAAALIREEVGRGGEVLVTAPAELRSHWARHLRGTRWRWVSHTSMSRRECDRHSATLVVVDEAHAFRNPSTKRYAALALACEQARVLLLSATPVNNSLLDFYNLVHLFAADDAFVDIGVPDMRAAFEAARRTGRSAGVRRIADTIMVRHTREMVALWGSRTRLTFPQSGDIEVLEYDLPDACPGLAECA
ncbi:MAG TPA: SNF2-related protein, partial [Longimicrobiales bacterium]